MDNSMNVNFLYLITAIIILIFVYILLMNTKKSIHNKKILLETKKKLYEIPYDMSDVYLSNIRKNLPLLYKSADKSCENLRKFIDSTHKDLENFMGDGPKTDKKIADIDLMRYDVMTEYEFLKNGLETTSDDSQTKAFINILIDIEIILYLIRNDMCRDKKLVLTSLHNLMEELYTNRCKDGETYDMITVENFTGDLNEMTDIIGLDAVNVKKYLNQGVSTYGECSQNIKKNVLDDEIYSNEEETPLYTIYKGSNMPKIDKRDLISQNFDCSADYIVTTKNSQPHAPFCDIEKLREVRKKIQKLTLDMNFSRSLRNDYDFLDA